MKVHVHAVVDVGTIQRFFNIALNNAVIKIKKKIQIFADKCFNLSANIANLIWLLLLAYNIIEWFIDSDDGIIVARSFTEDSSTAE